MSSVAALNIQRFVRTVGEIFKQGLVITDEEDQWFRITYDHLEAVEQQLEQVQSEINFLSGDRKDLAKAMSLLNRSVAAFSICEQHTELARTLDKLADVHSNCGSIQNYDAEMGGIFLRIIADQVQSIRHFKTRIVNRSHAWQNLNNTEQQLQKKRDSKVQNYLLGKGFRVEQEKKEVNELEKHVETLRDDLARMDELVRSDYERFAKKRLEDLKAGCVEWLTKMMESEQKVLDNWESLSKHLDRIETPESKHVDRIEAPESKQVERVEALELKQVERIEALELKQVEHDKAPELKQVECIKSLELKHVEPIESHESLSEHVERSESLESLPEHVDHIESLESSEQII